MASYPITEAALMEAVPDAVRGGVFDCSSPSAGWGQIIALAGRKLDPSAQ
jgi:hypothetical protein